MSGALRYRLRTSGGPLAASSLAIVHAVTVVSSQAAWRGDFLWGLQQLGSGLYLAVPVIMGLACLPSVLPGGAATERSLLPVQPRSARLRRYAVDLVPVLAAHLAFVAYVLAWTLAHGSVLTLSSLVTLTVQLLVLALAVAFGRFCGELTQHPAAVIGAALFGVLLLVYGEGLVRVAAGNSPYAGLELELGPYVVALVVLAVLTVALLASPAHTWVGGAVVGAVVVGALTFGIVLDEPTLRPDGRQASECEQVGEVDVCVLAGYEFMLDGMVDQSRRALTGLEEGGVEPHLERIAQAVPGQVEEPGHISVMIDVTSLQNDALNPTAVPASVLHPVWCPRINDPRPLPAAFDVAQIRAYAWLSWKSGMTDRKDFRLDAPKFSRLTEAEQRRAMQSFFDANLECRGLT